MTWRSFLGFVHSRGGFRNPAIAMILGSIAVALLAGRTVDSLFRMEAQLPPMLIVAMLPAVFLGASLYSPGPALEAALPENRIRLLRAGWFMALTFAVVALDAIAVLLSHPSEYAAAALIQVIRNAVFGLGVTGIVVTFLPQTVSWLPLAIFGMVCWIFGSIDTEGSPTAWALPLYPYEATAVSVVACGVWVAGFVTYLLRDGAAAR